jgi:hypothetical protein
MRWLIYHPESDCLFVESEAESMLQHLTMGCQDVTDNLEYEKRYLQLEHKKRETAEKIKVSNRMAVHRSLIVKMCYPSCLNCSYWMDNKCGKFNSVPPPEIIVFSCVDEYEEDIPF